MQNNYDEKQGRSVHRSEVIDRGDRQIDRRLERGEELGKQSNARRKIEER